MSLKLQQKKELVKEVGSIIKDAGSVVLAEYSGVEVDGMTTLRNKAREEGVYLRVLKNTLARRAVSGTPFEQLADHMKGPLAYGISKDPILAAKVLTSFAKENDKLVIRAGGMPNQVMSPTQVKQLATMPSREELIAKLLATMQATTSKFVRVLAEVPSGLVRTLAAVRDQKQESS